MDLKILIVVLINKEILLIYYSLFVLKYFLVVCCIWVFVNVFEYIWR